MTCEWKELLTDQAWGLAKWLVACPMGGLMLMKVLFSLIEAITGKSIYKTMTKKRKVQCWLHLSGLVMAFGVIFRCFSS